MYLLLIDIYHLIENKIVNIYIYILNDNIINIYVFILLLRYVHVILHKKIYILYRYIYVV
jgi:hypothetical protein